MNLTFAHDTSMDAQNVLRGSQSVNSSKPTNFYRALTEAVGDSPTQEQVEGYIRARIEEDGIDVAAEVSRIEALWRPIERAFVERVERLFETTYPEDEIVAYLTMDGRCTYRIEEGYFFVSMTARSILPHHTIMHELLHFYTWHAFGRGLIAAGMDKRFYNDIKESLSVLLNTDFHDLMGACHDGGYPQHAAMREDIARMRGDGMSVRAIVSALIDVPSAP